MLTQKSARSGATPILAAVYALLIVYGSLYPFSGWLPAEDMLAFLTAPWPRYIIRSDIITNILVYLPLGLLSARALRYRLRPVAASVAATAICLLLSFAMEGLQALLPDRVSSRLDLLLNGAGGLLGALLAGLAESPRGPLRRLIVLRLEWFLPGRLADLGLAALGLWALTQLSPLLLALDMDSLRKGLLPPWTPGYPSPFNLQQLAVYACSIAGLGLFASILARPGKDVSMPFAVFVAVVLLAKISVTGRYLSLETAAGAAIGISLAIMLRRSGRTLRFAAGGLALIAGFVLAELEPAVGAVFKGPQPFNWIPFRGQMHNLSGFSEILSLFWPFLALGCLFAFATRPGQRRPAALAGGMLLVLLMLALEWQQQFIPGRHADITDILLALGGWATPWWRRMHHQGKTHGQP